MQPSDISSCCEILSGSIAKQLYTLCKSGLTFTAAQLGILFHKYLEKLYNAHITIGTHVHQDSKLFKNLYQHINLRSKTPNVRITPLPDTDDDIEIHQYNSVHVNRILEAHKKLIITGTAGSGKSMTMNHILLFCIENKLFVPLFVSLRKFNNDHSSVSLRRLLYETAQTHDLNIEYNDFVRSLKTGHYIILLDGYDEVDPALRGKIKDEIINLSIKYDKNS